MLFLVAFLFCGVVAFTAMLLFAAVVVAVRGFGLTAVDARISLTVGGAAMAICLYAALRLLYGFETPTEQLQRAAYYACLVGGVMGGSCAWLAGLVVAWIITPREPIAAAMGVTIVQYLLFAAVAVGGLVGPGILVRRQADRLARYEAALADGDVVAMRELLDSGYRAHDLAEVIQREDIQMMELFMTHPALSKRKTHVHFNLVMLTGNAKLRKRFLELTDDRQAALDIGLRGAVIDGHDDDFQLLLELGADPNHNSTNSVLMFAAGYNRLAFAETLIAAGADVNAVSKAPSSYTGSTALIWATNKSDRKMVELLLDAGADVNLVAKHQDSALQVACRKGSRELVDVLLAKGADPNYQNRQLATALHIAESRSERNPEIIAALLAAGADENIVDRKGRTPAELRKP